MASDGRRKARIVGKARNYVHGQKQLMNSGVQACIALRTYSESSASELQGAAERRQEAEE